jgi:O-antigen/teichoic acid export membrane protein
VSRERREITRNTLFSIANEGATIVSATLAVLIMIPRFGTEDYGTFASLFALVGPFAAFAHGGVSLTLFEHLVGERDGHARTISSCLSISLAMAAVFSPLCVGLTLVLFDGVSFSLVAMFVAYEFVLLAVILTLISAVQGVAGYGPGMVLRIILQLVRILVVAVLALIGRLDLTSMVTTNLVVFLVLTVALVLVAPSLGVSHPRPGRIEKSHLRSSLLYAFGVSSSIVANDGDKVVMKASGHSADTGVYAAAYRFMSLAMLPLAAFTSSAHWSVLRSVEHDSNQVRRARRFTIVGLVYAAPVAVLLFLAAPIITDLLGDDFSDATSVIRWLSPVVLVKGMSIFPLNGLLGLGQNGRRAQVLVGGAAFSVIAYVALIPAHSWRGAVVATLLTEAVMICGGWIFLVRAQRLADEERHALGDAEEEFLVERGDDGVPLIDSRLDHDELNHSSGRSNDGQRQ